MPFRLGGWELVIVLVVVLLLFGPGRITKIASELGSGIRAFREGLKGEQEEASAEKTNDEGSKDNQ